MSNYEKFIKEFKEEADNINIADHKEIIKAQYKIARASPLKANKLGFKLSFSLLTVLLTAFFGYLIWSNDKVKPITEIPGITTISETYAFEIAAAANMVYNMQDKAADLASVIGDYDLLDLARKTVDETTLNDVTGELNKYIYTVKQLLDNETVKTSEKEIVDDRYQYQMTIKALLVDSLLMEYTMVYNKIDVGDNVYHIDGVIEIEGQIYIIKGSQEILDERQTLVIRIYFSVAEFISIHQIVEDETMKFIYREFANNRRVSELAIGIGEQKGYRVISIDAREGRVTGRFDALYVKNKLIVRSHYYKYKGDIIVNIISFQEVKYYFITEKKEIIIKKSDNLEIDYRFF